MIAPTILPITTSKPGIYQGLARQPLGSEPLLTQSRFLHSGSYLHRAAIYTELLFAQWQPRFGDLAAPIPKVIDVTANYAMKATTSQDLLAIPAVLLGFTPQESCVVLGLEAGQVRFCARADLAWLADQPAGLADQVRNAQDNFEQSELVLLGYSADPMAAALVMADFLAVLGSAANPVLVADAKHYWELAASSLEPAEGIEWELSQCQLVSQAVYHGVPIGAGRSQKVAEVMPPTPSQLAELDYLVEQVTELLAQLEPEEQFAQLQRLVESKLPLRIEEAVELALLLAVTDHAVAVVARLSIASAKWIRARLVEARGCCDDALAYNVVALLGLACWLDGEAAQLSECLVQLAQLAPEHPIFKVLKRFHALAIPPTRWDALS